MSSGRGGRGRGRGRGGSRERPSGLAVNDCRGPLKLLDDEERKFLLHTDYLGLFATDAFEYDLNSAQGHTVEVKIPLGTPPESAEFLVQQVITGAMRYFEVRPTQKARSKEMPPTVFKPPGDPNFGRQVIAVDSSDTRIRDDCFQCYKEGNNILLLVHIVCAADAAVKRNEPLSEFLQKMGRHAVQNRQSGSFPFAGREGKAALTMKAVFPASAAADWTLDTIQTEMMVTENISVEIPLSFEDVEAAMDGDVNPPPSLLHSLDCLRIISQRFSQLHPVARSGPGRRPLYATTTWGNYRINGIPRLSSADTVCGCTVKLYQHVAFQHVIGLVGQWMTHNPQARFAGVHTSFLQQAMGNSEENPFSYFVNLSLEPKLLCEVLRATHPAEATPHTAGYALGSDPNEQYHCASSPLRARDSMVAQFLLLRDLKTPTQRPLPQDEVEALKKFLEDVLDEYRTNPPKEGVAVCDAESPQVAVFVEEKENGDVIVALPSVPQPSPKLINLGGCATLKGDLRKFGTPLQAKVRIDKVGNIGTVVLIPDSQQYQFLRSEPFSLCARNAMLSWCEGKHREVRHEFEGMAGVKGVS